MVVKRVAGLDVVRLVVVVEDQNVGVGLVGVVVVKVGGKVVGSMIDVRVSPSRGGAGDHRWMIGFAMGRENEAPEVRREG